MRDDKYWRFELDVSKFIFKPTDSPTLTPHRTLCGMIHTTQEVKSSPKLVVLVLNFIADLPLVELRLRVHEMLGDIKSPFMQEIEVLRAKSLPENLGKGFTRADFLLYYQTQAGLRKHSRAHAKVVMEQLIKENHPATAERPLPMPSDTSVPAKKEAVLRRKLGLEITDKTVTVR